ncbi:hypothetical protein [Streptomyces hokutonensis]|uniref:Uncharacterized protein n=1 Tax=Streptomyces hokutonensis TaxID=1306990 RepID=A0ABW6M757_9ACTN
MGSNLRRQLREALPPGIKGMQRAVALEIADDARYDDEWNYNPETGRRSRVRLAELVRWTAAKDELSIREMLRRLSLAGWEFRIPIGKDKNGNLLYAVPGKAMTFRVPDFEGPTTVGPEVEIEVEANTAGPTTVGPEDSEGPTVSGQGPTVVAEGPTSVGAGPTVVGAGPTTVGPPSPPISSFSTKESPSSSTVVAEDSGEGAVEDSDGTEGGGGGNLDSSEDQEQDKPIARAESFVDSLDYRGQQLGQTRRARLAVRVAAAFKAGWTENGLRRYLDISDDPNVRSAAAVYAHRLGEDELPDASAGTDSQLPPACWDCLGANPAAAADLALRVNPITSDPCPNCHPASVGQKPEVPPVCPACLEENPYADRNVRLRYRIIDGQHQACPDCHPKRIVILAAQGAANIQQRLATGDWKGAGPDERALGWLQLSRNLSVEERINVGPQPPAGQRKALNVGRRYDNDVWSRPADPAKAAKIPHCGDPNCDPVTRLKTGPDWTGEPHTSVCDNCHPASKFG